MEVALPTRYKPFLVGAWEGGTPLSIGAVTTAPTKGTTAVDRILYRKWGDEVKFKVEYRQTGAGSAGSGSYLFNMPNNFKIDMSKLHTNAIGSFLGAAIVAGLGTLSGSSFSFLAVGVDNPSQFYLAGSGGGPVISSSFYALSNAGISLFLDFNLPIVGYGS
jgi:hypothetical protein